MQHYYYLTHCPSLSLFLCLLICSLLISQIRIRVGEYDFSHVQEQLPYIERAVSKKVVHPKYNFFTYEYDLALVKLEQPLEFAPHVSPICLPETESLLIGMNATVTGWGRLSEGGTLPSVLQEVSKLATNRCHIFSLTLNAGLCAHREQRQLQVHVSARRPPGIHSRHLLMRWLRNGRSGLVPRRLRWSTAGKPSPPILINHNIMFN